MNSKFECFVEIYDQKYDVVIIDLGFSIKFSDIYPKIQKIVKIAINEEISFITHKFEIFEFNCSPNEGSLVSRTDQLVTHKSTILISRKPRPLPSLPSIPLQTNGQQLPPIDRSDFSRDENYLQKCMTEIEAYNTIVTAINLSWDLKSRSKHWRKVSFQLKQWNISYRDSVELNFQHWTRFYAKNYYRVDGKVSERSQEIFDLLKIVHVLDLDKIFEKHDHIIDRLTHISRESKSIDFYNKFLKDLRFEKLLTKGKNENQCNYSKHMAHYHTPGRGFYS